MWGVGPGPVQAQQTRPHLPHNAWAPPGLIGYRAIHRGEAWQGYFQPVEIIPPQGAQVAIARQGKFDPPQDRLRVGLLVGRVYRLRVIRIPGHLGQELFPTLEVIDRTFAPAPVAVKFPVPVRLEQEDLELALQGKFVLRVIYLEDPRKALPVSVPSGEVPWFEVRPGEDPLQMARALGRPLAILRLGGRTPRNIARPGADFLYGSPPFLYLHAPPGQPNPPRTNKTAAGKLRFAFP